jgi:hypothetical protein
VEAGEVVFALVALVRSPRGWTLQRWTYLASCTAVAVYDCAVRLVDGSMSTQSTFLVVEVR